MKKFILCLGLFVFSQRAHSEYNFYIKSGSDLRLLSSSPTKWEWKNDKVNNVVLLVAELEVRLPKSFATLRSKGTRAKFGPGNRTLILNVETLNPLVVLEDSNGVKTIIVGKWRGKGFVQDLGCRELNVQLKFLEKHELPMGIRCVETQKAKSIRVTLIAPEDVSFMSSDLYDERGKGERWKEYHLKENTLESTKDYFGTFEFSFQTKTIKASLLPVESKKAVEVLSKTKRFKRFTLGPAQYSLATKSGQTNVSGSGLGFFATANANVWERAHLEANVSTGQANPDGKTLKYFEFQAVSEYRLLNDYICPQVMFLSVTSNEAASLINMSHQQLAAGLASRIKIFSGSLLELRIWKSLTGTGSHLAYSANWSFFENSTFGVGLRFESQAFSKSSPNNSTIDITNTNYGIFLRL